MGQTQLGGDGSGPALAGFEHQWRWRLHGVRIFRRFFKMEDETALLTHTLSSFQDVTIRTLTAERPICVDTLPKFTVIWI